MKIVDALLSVDWIGSALMLISSTSFLVGMSWGGNKYQWKSAAVLIPMFGGLAGLIVTVLYERYSATNPFLRLTIFKTWSGKLVSICTLLQGYLVSVLRATRSRLLRLTEFPTAVRNDLLSSHIPDGL